MLDAPGPSTRRSSRSANGDHPPTGTSAPSRKGKERASDVSQTPGRKAKLQALEAIKGGESDDSYSSTEEGEGDQAMEVDSNSQLRLRSRTRSSHLHPTPQKASPPARPRRTSSQTDISTKTPTPPRDEDDKRSVQGPGGDDGTSLVDVEGEDGQKDKGTRRGAARRSGLRKISVKPIVELTEDEAEEDEAAPEEDGDAMDEDEEDGDLTVVQESGGEVKTASQRFEETAELTSFSSDQIWIWTSRMRRMPHLLA